MERSARTASQLKRHIDQSRENLKIVRKGQSSRDVSSPFKQQMKPAKDRSRARAIKSLLEANARWNQTRRDSSANDIRRIVDKTSTINPELRKVLLYSWKRGFIEHKPIDQSGLSLVRKKLKPEKLKGFEESLKEKMVSESPSMVKRQAKVSDTGEQTSMAGKKDQRESNRRNEINHKRNTANLMKRSYDSCNGWIKT